MANKTLNIRLTLTEAPTVKPNSNGKQFILARGTLKNGRKTTVMTYCPGVVEGMRNAAAGDSFPLIGEYRRSEGGITFSATAIYERSQAPAQAA